MANVPQSLRCFSRFHVRQVLFLIFFWFCICFLVFHIKHNQINIGHIGSRVAVRELLQQSLDYSLGTNRMDRRHSDPNNKINVLSPQDLTEKQLLKLLNGNSNLPLEYWTKARTYDSRNKTCSKFPSLYDLDFNNIYWQRLQLGNTTFYFYGAYLDDRPGAGKVPLVRILAMVDKIQPPPMFCQLWYDGLVGKSHHYFSETTFTYMWYRKWGNYENGKLQPFIISCPVPENATTIVPASVSIVEHHCDNPTNNLRVINNRPEKKEDFAVCVKGLDFLFQDISLRLVEWIELLNILGAKKIFLYELEVHPNVSKVLSYYVKRGIVELTPITLPGDQPNLPGFRHLYLKSKVINKRQNELIPYNDCLYKNIHSYDFVVLLDTDEIIMPLQELHWSEMMPKVMNMTKRAKVASYNFRNVYFLDDVEDGEEADHQSHEDGVPKYLHMLHHVYRSKNYTDPGSYVKCFHNTELVVSLHNHFPVNCYGQCTTYSVNTSMAHMQHYRKDCVGPLKKVCKDYRNYTVRDTAIWRYKDELIQRVNKALSDMGFLDSVSQIKSS